MLLSLAKIEYLTCSRCRWCRYLHENVVIQPSWTGAWVLGKLGNMILTTESCNYGCYEIIVHYPKA